MQVTRSEDGKTAILSFLEGSGVSGSLSLDEAQLSQLIASLGLAHAALIEKRPPAPIAGARFTPVYTTHWALQIDALTEGSMLAFQHPAYGPVGVVFGPQDVEQIIRGLQKQRTMIRSNPQDASTPS
ncbi:hypothetical protein [Gluconobacter albidus]|uniref:hypothetical protein n=1 Tax=Gluconobacter albidus TaxID=318683 RepID=UPI001B8CB33F|nr:hypothetical protein [Gluconobacter albidus]MBS1027944.1 hypothetical protein [Gluconobacter albidus]